MVTMTEVKGVKEFFKKMDAVAAAYDKLPNEVAAIAVKFSKDRFRSQSWLDYTEKKWPPRVRRRKGKRRSQTLLVDKGYLKRSVRKIVANQNVVIIGSDAPYAQIQNDGGTIKETVTVSQHTRHEYKRKAYTRKRAGRTERIKSTIIKSHTVKSHRRKMNVTIPARKFLGQSNALEQQLVDHIKNRFDEALNK